MTNLYRAVLCLSFAAAVWNNPAVASTWAMKVTALANDGKEAPEAKLTIIENGKPAERNVKRGYTFPVGVVIVLPARIKVTMESSNGNTVTLLPGARLRVSSGSGRGEEYGLDTGKASFTVKKALDFFNVRHEKFQAIVRGTAYSVEVIPEQEIRFVVEEGKVKIEREATIFIDEGQSEANITVGEIMNAGEQKNYRLDIEEYLARYQNFGEAEAYYRKNLEADRASGDPERLVAGLNQMGVIFLVLSRYDDAKSSFEESLLQVRRLRPGGIHNDIALALNNLGNATTNLGGTENIRRAIGHYEEALKIRRQLFPSGIHGDIASVLNNLGNATRDLGGMENSRRAIGYYEEALNIRRQLYPDGKHTDIAASLNNLGNASRELGGTENVRRAVGYSEEALKIRRQLFPNGIHKDIAYSLNNLANATSNLGGTENVRRAVGYYEEALKIRRQLFPTGVHNDIANVLNNLGNATRNLGGTENVRRAISYSEEALKIRRQLFPGGVHNDIASSLNSLGIATRELGGTENIRRAIGHYEEALKIRRQLFPSGFHTDIASSLNDLGNATSSLGGAENVLRAIGHYEEALKIRRQLFPTDSLAAPALGNLAFNRILVAQYAEALRDAREALKLDPSRTWIRTNEAHALLFLGRFEEALAIYSKFKDERINPSMSFRDAVLSDFARFKKAGLSHADMEKIEKLFGEPKL